VDVAAGQFVIVPLGKREVLGVVWGEGTGEVAVARLRDVIEVLPALPMAAPLRRFIDWVAAYTLAPPGAVLRMAMGSPSALEAPKTELVYRPSVDAGDALRLTAARRRVLEVLKDGPAMAAPELAHLAGVGTSVVRTMAAAGLLEIGERIVRRSFPQPDGGRDGPSLSPCSTVCRVRARPRSISKPLRRRLRWAGRRSCCCRRSRLPLSG
jgi:primosomal protein N' (replication factor Y)